jgi:hypothetical protein
MSQTRSPDLRRHAAEIEGDLVVLDIDADRYYLVPSPARTAAEFERRATKDRASSAQVLAGWTMPTASVNAADGRRSLGATANALFCLLTVSRLLRRRTFAELVTHIEQASPAARRRRPRVEDLVASFAAVRPLFNYGRICRLDAPALCLLLRRYGFGARLVFAARLRPFAAHCWAQVEEAVVNETPDAVRQYTPILAI